MEYSIQELSRLSGVTTRTLRWYDQIGLLKPSRVAESGYRYYGGAEVDRLQGCPAKPPGRIGGKTGAAGTAHPVGERHHRSGRKERDHER